MTVGALNSKEQTAAAALLQKQAGAAIRKKSICSPSARVRFWIRQFRFRLGELWREKVTKARASAWKRWEAGVSRLQGRKPRGSGIRFVPRLLEPACFDEAFYKSQFGCFRSHTLTPLEHYCEKGWKRGYNPHPLFDVRWYLKTNPDVQRSGQEPLRHFMQKGWREGRNPNPFFNIDYYLAACPELAKRLQNPLLHYAEVGWKEGRAPGPLFSEAGCWSRIPNLCPDAEPLGQLLRYIDPSAWEEHTEYRGWPCVSIPCETSPGSRPSPGTVAVHLHAFYIDRIDMIFEFIKNIPVRFDLLVSTSTEADARDIEKAAVRLGLDCRLEIKIVENRGRDVAPLLCTFGRELLKYDVALHVHTKKSVYAETAEMGQRWLLHNLRYLAWERSYINGVLSLLSAPECGVLVPEPWQGVRSEILWAKNRALSEQLMERLHLPTAVLDKRQLMFPAGTMFWFKPAALRPLLASDLSLDDFPPEPLPQDGTLAHAVERCVCYVALAQGYESRMIRPDFASRLCLEGPNFLFPQRVPVA